MDSDRALGALIVIGVIAAAVAYFGLYFLVGWKVVVDVLVTIGFLVILGIGGWIGWTMASTPTPEPIEDLDLEDVEDVEEDLEIEGEEVEETTTEF